jgi:hypothetical protein
MVGLSNAERLMLRRCKLPFGTSLLVEARRR